LGTWQTSFAPFLGAGGGRTSRPDTSQPVAFLCRAEDNDRATFFRGVSFPRAASAREQVSPEPLHPDEGLPAMNPEDKPRYRTLKRDVKRAGNKRRRHFLKRELRDNPEEAPHSEFDFGDTSSEALNGLDQDATRRRKPKPEGD